MLLKLMKVSLTAYAMWTYSLAEAAKQEQESSDSVMIASDGSMFA
ncbi:MAG: hypothetical protein K0Q57_638, partial [Gammaproteobacteria bacterium]|nr:hypothetical protein [Gammaproteobacteria bacterium]